MGVKESGASKTAEYMAFFRALESEKPGNRRLFFDRFAHAFLGPRLKAALALTRVPLLGRIVPWIMDSLWPGARTSGVARTRLIDDMLMTAVGHEAQQLVLLGWF